MTVVAMSSLFSFQSPSTACITSVGVQAFLVGSLVGCMAGTLLREGVPESLALITDEPHVGVDVRSLWFDFQVPTSHPLPPSTIGWYFLPKPVFKKTHSLEEREIACS
jgi:hypothetical protein